MSTFAEPPPGKLFVSVLFQNPDPRDSAASVNALAQLEAQYGRMDVVSPILAFNFTRYYVPEMGEPLWRRAVSFERLIPRGQLVEIKHFCARLEGQFLTPQGQRQVNIDPGLLTPENLVLATGKNITHRVYLQRGVYADLALLYRGKKFNPLPWTYPDYAAPELMAILLEMRTRLLAGLQAHERATH